MKGLYYVTISLGMAMMMSACASSIDNDEPEYTEEEEEEYQDVPYGSGWEDCDGYSRNFDGGGWYTYYFDGSGDDAICKTSTYSTAYDSKASATTMSQILKSEGKVNVTQDGRIVTYDISEYLGMSYKEIRLSFGKVQERYLSGYWKLYKYVRIDNPDSEDAYTTTNLVKDNPLLGEIWVINAEKNTFEKYRARGTDPDYYWEYLMYGDFTFKLCDWGAFARYSYDYYNAVLEAIGYPHELTKGGNIIINKLDQDNLIMTAEGTWGVGHTTREYSYYTRTDKSELK